MWFWLAWIALAGCGSAGGESADTNNHGYGFQYDEQGPNGLRLRYTPVLAANTWPTTYMNFYEAAFNAVEQCTGMSAAPPFVVWDHLSGVGGLYYSRPSLIVLDQFGTLRHEFVHYLLDTATGDPDADHRSRFFGECV